MNAQELLSLADDELILGWHNSEWTGIAPFLEEDVAFSSIAQTEIGHARAWYELAAKELGTDADSLAFDREPDEYACSPLVELRMAEDWDRFMGFLPWEFRTRWRTRPEPRLTHPRRASPRHRRTCICRPAA